MKSPRIHHRAFFSTQRLLSHEWHTFNSVIEELNEQLARTTGAVIEPLSWWTGATGMGRRSHAELIKLVDECDCFIMVLEPRRGSDTRHTSLIEPEYERALTFPTTRGHPDKGV